MWRYHKEVASQLEKELEKEQELPPYVRQEDVSAMEWVTAHERIEKHASVSIDGVKVMVRGEGYREVKMVSVSEVVGQEESEFPGSEEMSVEEALDKAAEEAQKILNGE